MNRICVLKDVAYAAKIGGGVIASINEINSLQPGALAFFTPNGTLLTAANAAATVPDIKSVKLASGRSADNQLINFIPRKLDNITRGNYRAFTKPVITIASLSVADGDEGEMFVKVSDVSYTSRYNPQPLNASVYKKASQTASAAIDALVAKLNQTGSYVTAAKTGGGPYNITITPKDDGVAIEVSVGGLIEGDSVSTTTAPVYGIGGSDAVLQMEKDFSVEEGNGNYIEYPTEHFSVVTETVAGTNYDLISLLWEGTHNSATRETNVMHNRVVIGCVNGAGNGQAAADIMALLALIFANVYAAATGAETGTDDGTDHDGVSGN